MRTNYSFAFKFESLELLNRATTDGLESEVLRISRDYSCLKVNFARKKLSRVPLKCRRRVEYRV